MVKIAFALPVPNAKIIGGYKVVYEYSNYLASKGCDVTIFYNAHNGINSMHLPRVAVLLIRWKIGKFGPKWFDLNQKVHKRVLSCYKKDSFNGYDIVVATATETAKYVNEAQITPENKWYFVQDFEDWGRSKNEVIDTYKMGMHIIAISKWLKRIIENTSGREVIYIPNGIDKNVFNIKIPYINRGKHTLSTLYHWDQRKGCDVALRTIYRLKERYHDLEVFLFGAPQRKTGWPEWIHYIQKASPLEVCDSMNQARVFLCTSRQEGFGLTGLESIFCGCTLVTTDCLGIREYASEKNAYICSVDDEKSIFARVCQAFDDEEGALEKRCNCQKLIEGFDAEASRNAFYNAITGSVI